MAYRHSIGFISLLLLLLQIQLGCFAPTHHLKISVEGNTPRLIVTSAEIGITSNIDAAATSSTTSNATSPAILKGTSTGTTTTTATEPLSEFLPQSTKWLHKANQLKPKSKSFTTQHEKKRDKSTKDRKTLAWEAKSATATSATPAAPSPDTTKLQKLGKTAVKSKKIMKFSNVMTTSKPREILASEASEYNESKDETERTTSLTSAPTSTSRATTRSASWEKKLKTIKSSVVAPRITTLLPGKLPQTSASMVEDTATADTVLAVTSIMTPERSISTDAATTTIAAIVLTTTPIPSSSHGPIDVGLDVGNMKAPPEAFTGKSSLTMETTSTPSSSFSMEMTTTTTTTTVITTEVNDVDNVQSSTIKTVADAKKSSKDYVTQGKTVPKYLSTLNRRLVTVTPSPTSAMDTPTTAAAPTQTITSTTAASDAKSFRSTTMSSSIDAPRLKPTDSGNDAAQQTVIKLIDLEKHETAVDELRTNKQSHLDSGGHDGVKQTKKKQLLDKHFIADMTTGPTMERSIETSTLPSASTTFKPDINKKPEMVISPMHQHEQPNIEKPVLMAPTLAPAFNGYLGPIRITERTFSVKPNLEEKQKLFKHETSIDSKLQDGRIVEIIAPTALLEPDTSTSATLKSDQVTRSSSTVEPNTENLKQPDRAAAVLSTTVFQVPEPVVSTTRKPINARTVANPIHDDRRESRISDIQIEVYDSVVTPQRNHQSNEYNRNSSEFGRTRPPVMLPTTQERFTQYVVDRIESSTPDTIENVNLNFHGIGKPEPAAIEIHINVSEDMTNLNDNVDFSYRQEENGYDFDSTNDITIRPPNSQSNSSNGRNDDILVLEIVDTSGDNSSTETQANIKPTITFRTSADAELNDDASDDDDDDSPQAADELFMADSSKKNGFAEDSKPPLLPPPPPPQEPTAIERDSDTIFYISNTEVKVGESPPNPVSVDGNQGNRPEQIRRTRLESQFYPASYMASTYPNMASGQQMVQPMQQKHLYEEDIILSPVRNTADSLKIFRSQNDGGAPPLDITYVGESVIEVEQSSDGGSITTTVSATAAPEPSVSSAMATQTPDVIIQPAILPEMSIGVPVIGELPPQIELKEIDFMPNEANQQRSGVHETENNDIEDNLSDNNNDMDRLVVESSIQYGGDLIDEGAAADSGGGFDGGEGSYPFGNMAAMRRRTKNNDAADYAHFAMHYGVNNLRKDELSVDVANAAREARGRVGVEPNENSTTILQNGNETSASMNITYAIAERIESNTTTFYIDELQVNELLRARGQLPHGPIESLIICALLLMLAPATFLIPYFSFRLYKRFRRGRNDSESSDDIIPNGNVARCDPAELTSKGDEDISRDARETKMHYTSDKDGVFVVEVARGADSKIIPESPIAELADDHLFVQQPKFNANNNKSPTRKYEDEHAVLNNHEHVQIHQPPTELSTSNAERSLHQIEEVEEESIASPKVENPIEMNFEPKANTGLSQSDLSSTSSADSNKRYNYGNQVLYTNDQTDYTSSSPVNLNATAKRLPTVEPQDDDHTSENGQNSNATPEKSNSDGEEQFAQDKKNPSENENNETSNNEKVEHEHEIKAVEMEVEMIAEAEAEVKVDEEQIFVDGTLSHEDVEIQDVELCPEQSQVIEMKVEEEEAKDEEEKEAEKEEAKEEAMSVSDVDCAMESATSETDTTQILIPSKEITVASNNPQEDDNQADFESLAQAETDPEFTYDSLMSLPDPPSNEEMTQFGDFNGIETAQLDSLPPPPPPPLPPSAPISLALQVDENTNMPDILAEIKSKSCQIQSINGNIEYSTGHGNLNGHESSASASASASAFEQNKAQALPLPPPIQAEEINSNGKIMPNSPLTPPESPPPSPPAQYSNGVMGINEQLCAASVHAVAVDVNGS